MFLFDSIYRKMAFSKPFEAILVQMDSFIAGLKILWPEMAVRVQVPPRVLSADSLFLFP